MVYTKFVLLASKNSADILSGLLISAGTPSLRLPYPIINNNIIYTLYTHRQVHRWRTIIVVQFFNYSRYTKETVT